MLTVPSAVASTPIATALPGLWDAYRREPSLVLREQLARHYVGLVHHMAWIFARRSSALDASELVGAGSLGLLRALERFDADRGLAFSTYAVQCIRGAILDELRRRDWMPRGLRARARRIATTRAQLEARLQRCPTPSEVAVALKLTLAEYWKWCDEIAGPGGTLADPEAEPDLLESEEHEALRAVLATLPERLQEVLGLLYFEELTARQVAGLLGVTESRISQLRKRALDLMRARLKMKMSAVEGRDVLSRP